MVPPPAGGPRRPWASWAAPVLLSVVAAVQMVLATRWDLNAWKGGGFGMFSTNDRPAARAILCIGTRAGGGAVAVREAGLRNLADADVLTRFRTLPNAVDAAAIARAVGSSQDGPPARLARIQLSVWRLRFDPERRIFRWERAGPVFTVPAPGS